MKATGMRCRIAAFMLTAGVLGGSSMFSTAVFADENSPLPIGENEYLVLTTGEDHYSWLGGEGVWIVGQTGQVVKELPGYGMLSSGSSMSDGLVADADTPLILFTGGEGDQMADGITRESGLFSLQTMDWIVEPQPVLLQLFSDTVYATYTANDMTVGNLYRIDGTCIEENAEQIHREGDYIIDQAAVYDLEGNKLMTFPENTRFLSVTDKGILQAVDAEDGSHKTILTDSSGNLLMEEDTGLFWKSCDSFLSSWTDASGAGVIIAMNDSGLMQMIDESMFKTLNPEAVGTGMELAAFIQTDETKFPQNIIRMDEDMQTSHYYLCDENYEILEEYPASQVYQDRTADTGTNRLWYWGITIDDVGFAQNLLTGSQFTWTQKDLSPDDIAGMAQSVKVMQEGPITGVLYCKSDGMYTFVCGSERQNQVFTAADTMNAQISSLPDGTIEVYLTSGNTDKRTMLYYSADGALLTSDDQVLFCNQSLLCRQVDQTIEISDISGNLLLQFEAGQTQEGSTD
jgi:hypothetical protein